MPAEGKEEKFPFSVIHLNETIANEETCNGDLPPYGSTGCLCADTRARQSAGDKPAGSGSHLHTCHKQHTGGIHQYRQRTTEKTEFRTRPAISVEYDTLRHYYQRCRCRGGLHHAESPWNRRHTHQRHRQRYSHQRRGESHGILGQPAGLRLLRQGYAGTARSRYLNERCRSFRCQHQHADG